MKALKTFFIVIMSLTMFTTCDESANDQLFENDQLQHKNNNDEYNAKTNHSVTIPFKATFYTKRDYSNSGEGFCTEDPFLTFNYQVGKGQGTHLGRFETTMSFCGAGFSYANGTGEFIAANGDTLYIAIPSEGDIGLVKFLTYDDPLYEAEFQDPFSFIGGTGRFEGASGGGMTNSFVDLLDDDGNFIPEHRTDHQWTGVLIIPKSNE